ncbi:hypothetical protein G9A89_002942 [Geosiphon pyriformis]|nr:hypothetical protein G9A89_002942 [Geosiphon pyriformis]
MHVAWHGPSRQRLDSGELTVSTTLSVHMRVLSYAIDSEPTRSDADMPVKPSKQFGKVSIVLVGLSKAEIDVKHLQLAARILTVGTRDLRCRKVMARTILPVTMVHG